LTERIDRKQLQLKKLDSEIKGQLFKAFSWGNSTFGSLPDFNNDSDIWGAFEMIYPDELISWDDLYDFIEFVLEESADNFNENWSAHFDPVNAQDYFLFLNLIRARDNTGKNTFIAKPDINKLLLYIPFDLDGTHGIWWDGSLDKGNKDILTNGFYTRLLKDCQSSGFSMKIKERWLTLRKDLLAYDNLISMAENAYSILLTNGVYQREETVWDYTFDETAIDYYKDWLWARLEYLDSYFASLCEPSQVMQQSKASIKFVPNPVDNYLSIESKSKLINPELSIFDLYGKLIMHTVELTTLDLSALPSGCYILFLHTDSKTYRDRIIKN